MKKMILCGLFFLCFYSMTIAQKTGQGAAKQTKKTATRKAGTGRTAKQDITINRSVSVNNSNAYAAPSVQYRIFDPVVLGMNKKVNGHTIPPDLNAVDVMPKGTYGLANGRIILMPSGARTSGGITGTGGIGTGTSIGIMSTNGPAMQVNGKNPYAAPGIYGDRMINVYKYNFLRDSLPVLNRNKP
jgi:hypothetical protein